MFAVSCQEIECRRLVDYWVHCSVVRRDLWHVTIAERAPHSGAGGARSSSAWNDPGMASSCRDVPSRICASRSIGECPDNTALNRMRSCLLQS